MARLASRRGNRVLGRMGMRQLRKGHAVAIFGVTVLALIGANASSAVREKSSEGCYVRLMQLKTLSDPQRNLVNLHPKNTTLAAINALPQPHPTPKTRSTNFERRVWLITVQIVRFKVEGDSDIRLILFDGGAYGIAEMPAARCLPKRTRDRKAIIAAREKFTSKFGEPTSHWKELGAVVMISGVGFFDIPHTPKPHAQNFAELHPVTGIRFA
jgi:hypothetical protein